MNKSIFKTAVAVTAVAVFSIGCTEKAVSGGNGHDGLDDGYDDPNSPNYIDPNNPFKSGSGGNIVGDWSLVEYRYESDGKVEVLTPDVFSGGWADDYKVFNSFNSSGDLAFTSFERWGNIGIERADEAVKYTIKGDSVCFDDDYCTQYRVAGNRLYVGNSGQECDNGTCHSYSSTTKFVKGNVASTRSSFGNNLKSQDPLLNGTEWERPSSDPDCEEYCGRDRYCVGNDRISFSSGFFHDSRGIYISTSCAISWDSEEIWYTENGNRLIWMKMECDKYETVREDGEGWETCVSRSVYRTVTLDYQLANGTLRLKAPGKNWDTWTPYVYDNNDGGLPKSKARAKSKKETRSISPFQSFRR